MSTIRGTFDIFARPEHGRPCIWCRALTNILMETPGRPDLGSVPLHALCAAEIVAKFDEWRARRRLDEGAAPHPALEQLLRLPPPPAS